MESSSLKIEIRFRSRLLLRDYYEYVHIFTKTDVLYARNRTIKLKQ